jgi:hypothetical protein
MTPSSTVATCDSTPDLVLDSKLALIKRLYDVVFRISNEQSSHLDRNAVAAIHSEVDRIEVLVKGGERLPARDEDRVGFQDLQAPTSPRYDALSSQLAPTQEAQMPVDDAPIHPPRLSLQQAPTMTISRAIEIANAAEELASQLAASVEEFEKRREESDVTRPSPYDIFCY